MAEVTWATCRAPNEGARCRRCRGPVIWTDTANGRKLAVDPVPTTDGRVELQRVAGKLYAVQHGGPPPEGQVRYRAHVAACTPRVRGWRGRR